MLRETEINQLVKPFNLCLDARQLDQVKIYLELLLRWNEKINLTSIRDSEECVTRHFGESLFLATYEHVTGDLLDIGSGAGFPGLALKIVFPDVRATLLEPVAKKRAFLKEVCRTCGFSDVEVRPERLEDWVDSRRMYDVVTARAVGGIVEFLDRVGRMMAESGKIHLWLSRQQAEVVKQSRSNLSWSRENAIPLSLQRVILTGEK